MNLSETADLLTAMSAFDRRTIGDGDVVAWQSVLPDASFGDCLEAVKQHYAEHTDWIMPAHVRRLVRDMFSQREAEARNTGWAPGQAGVPREEAMPELSGPTTTQELSDGVRELLGRLRTMHPDGGRETLMPRRVAWEKEHRAYLRTHNPEPNPLYRPTTTGTPCSSDDEPHGEHPWFIGEDEFLCPGVGGSAPGPNGTVQRAACDIDGHPLTSHLCQVGGVPFPAHYYDTQATAGAVDPDPRD